MLGVLVTSQQEGKDRMATGELVLRAIAGGTGGGGGGGGYEQRSEHGKAMAGVLMLQAHENTMAKREEWTELGGALVHRRITRDHGARAHLVQLLDSAGVVRYFALSEQSSTDAEAHALQFWINEKAR